MISENSNSALRKLSDDLKIDKLIQEKRVEEISKSSTRFEVKAFNGEAVNVKDLISEIIQICEASKFGYLAKAYLQPEIDHKRIGSTDDPLEFELPEEFSILEVPRSYNGIEFIDLLNPDGTPLLDAASGAILQKAVTEKMRFNRGKNIETTIKHNNHVGEIRGVFNKAITDRITNEILVSMRSACKFPEPYSYLQYLSTIAVGNNLESFAISSSYRLLWARPMKHEERFDSWMSNHFVKHCESLEFTDRTKLAILREIGESHMPVMLPLRLHSDLRETMRLDCDFDDTVEYLSTRDNQAHSQGLPSKPKEDKPLKTGAAFMVAGVCPGCQKLQVDDKSSKDSTGQAYAHKRSKKTPWWKDKDRKRGNTSHKDTSSRDKKPQSRWVKRDPKSKKNGSPEEHANDDEEEEEVPARKKAKPTMAVSSQCKELLEEMQDVETSTSMSYALKVQRLEKALLLMAGATKHARAIFTIRQTTKPSVKASRQRLQRHASGRTPKAVARLARRRRQYNGDFIFDSGCEEHAFPSSVRFGTTHAVYDDMHEPPLRMIHAGGGDLTITAHGEINSGTDLLDNVYAVDELQQGLLSIIECRKKDY
jgi:hypothetical protein